MTKTTKQSTQVEMEAMKEPAKKEYDNEKRIVVFKNNKRTDLVRHPALRGHFTLNGKIYDVSLWCKYYPKDGEKEKMWSGEIQERGSYQNDENASVDDFFDDDQAQAFVKK